MFIHKSADVSDDAKLGENTKVWNNAQVREDVLTGKDCIISKDVYLDTGVVLGNRVKIQNGVSVYSGVTIDDDVFLGPHMTFTNDLFPRAHTWDPESAGKTHVLSGASVGAHATIVCGTKDKARIIGEHAMIAAGAVVTKDVPAHGFVMGVPAKLKGFVCKCGQKLKLDSKDDNHANMSCNSCSESVKIPIENYEMIK